MDFMDAMDAMDWEGAAVRERSVGWVRGVGRRAEGTPTVFNCDGSPGRRSGMKGSFETRLLFGVASSGHELLFVIM
jgi:hypothetical protein